MPKKIPRPVLDVDAIHKALANPVRRDILVWLKTPAAYFDMQVYPLDIGVCAGLIDQRTGLSQSTVSAHLANLQKAGLISATRVGQWIFFRRDEAVIQAFLDQLHGGL
ncbi:helix-turn-helix transcriptional regulator [Actimicrobium antarcticum]|uniref:Helix-turn-helix transcriptional regulator n=1 Tax=Actimicrobium antarcticum TaxID=1051899 RepID=A0ABP7TST6_9BURK